MKKTWLLLTVLLSTLSAAARAQDVDPRKAGFDPEKLAALRPRFQEFVDQQHLSGAVVLVARRGAVGSLEAVGFRDLEVKAPMRPDTIFRIASMTKPVTAAGILMLENEGKLSVDDPVEKHLPEFKGQMMVQSKAGGAVTLVKPPRPITLKDLLTHTSGLAGLPPGLSDLYKRRHRTLAEAVMAFSQRPLDFEPGTKWSYCNTGIDTLGRVIEVVSGKRYEDFLEERFFGPLGMKDTFFNPTLERLERTAGLYKREKEKLLSTDNFLGDLVDPKYPIPAGGLYSTAPDLFRFYQMLLDKGTRGDRRYLTEAAVEKMTSVQTGDLKTGFVDGMSFGLGVGVVREPRGITEMLSPGSYGHGGAFGTQGWIDPKKGMIFVLMIQRVGLPNGDASEMRKALQSIAAAAVAE
jgi:CubicO group peptidase (beta-lactamase class C family)